MEVAVMGCKKRRRQAKFQYFLQLLARMLSEAAR